MTGFAHGAALVARGFGLWRTRPRLMALGMLPAVLVAVVLTAAVVAAGSALPGIAAWATPFADGWAVGWRTAVRVALVVVALALLILLALAVFTPLVLALGDPFYARIGREVGRMRGDIPDGPAVPLGASTADAVRLGVLAVLGAAGFALLGFVPVLGPTVVVVLAFLFSARMTAVQLLVRPFEERGLGRHDRERILRGHRAAVLGLGVVVQAISLVPFVGVILVMPAAVAGAAMLTHEIAQETTGERG